MDYREPNWNVNINAKIGNVAPGQVRIVPNWNVSNCCSVDAMFLRSLFEENHIGI